MCSHGAQGNLGSQEGSSLWEAKKNTSSSTRPCFFQLLPRYMKMNIYFSTQGLYYGLVLAFLKCSSWLSGLWLCVKQWSKGKYWHSRRLWEGTKNTSNPIRPPCFQLLASYMKMNICLNTRIYNKFFGSTKTKDGHSRCRMKHAETLGA